ncbi:hypothetical protein DMC30DRAFT_411045 [Rhodotorula diobovata]|uniref:Fe2OG dioxygenase domain-containing protein n=1 Tax=Rhodotorula diobovata TaxID=5288 RepID=A0A5C5G1A2_9BASI|nr:hypothetical protein DMC30DRAFT_411045 [Rhodotorula diobovata]
MSRKKRTAAATTAPTNLTAFRCAERLWKDRSSNPDLSLAFDPRRILWEDETFEGRTRGVWPSGDGAQEEVCWRVPMGDLAEAGMGQTRWWKGKGREGGGDDYAIVIPRIPGLVFFPRILPEALQRALVVETLQHARRPNLTQLDKLYDLPSEGLWNAWTTGKGEEVVERTADAAAVGPGVTAGPSAAANALGLEGATKTAPKGAEPAQGAVTVRDLLPKLRWANVGWFYDWTTKRYEFDRGFVSLPPLVHLCCRALARQTPWQHVFSNDKPSSLSGKASPDWRRWKDVYDPDAGIVNFYQLKDSLTSHVDQAEVDAVSPLVSLSLGHSSVFLVGGTDRDTPPLAILLRSGDGLCMAGAGRRVYHGLPRVLEGSLPVYLRASQDEAVQGADDWRLYGEYLERGARINVNVRSVF